MASVFVVLFERAKIKKFYRYCLLREYCYSLDTSGWYDRLSTIKNISKEKNVSYNTIRQDFKYFQSQGWLYVHGENIRFKKLHGEPCQWYHIYQMYLAEIENHTNKACHFCGLIQRQILHKQLNKQIYKEAGKITDPNNRKQYLRIVRRTNTRLGAKQGIYCGLGTISKMFAKSKTTAFRYMSSMEELGIIEIYRNNRLLGRAVTPVQYVSIRQKHRLYGHTYWDPKTGNVYQRLLNDYLL